MTATHSSNKSWLRVVIQALIILVWVITAGIGGTMFGRVSEVSTNDQTAYLPSSSDAYTVQHKLEEFTGSDALPAIVVYTSDSVITPEAAGRSPTLWQGSMSRG